MKKPQSLLISVLLLEPRRDVGCCADCHMASTTLALALCTKFGLPSQHASDMHLSVLQRTGDTHHA
jgi:hypothetical protein